jgi:hypothetical protein
VSEQYTISAVSTQTRDYVSNGNANRVYYVKLEGVEADVPSQAFELHQRQTSRAPTSGQKIDVKTFVKGTHDGKPAVKIVKDWDAIKANQAGGGGQSSQGSDERGESIERQVAAKVAGLMVASHPVPQTGPVGVIANFEEFFNTVLKKIQGGSEASRNGGGEVPADMTGLPTSAPVTDDSQIKF